jgi:hypothetical protein
MDTLIQLLYELSRPAGMVKNHIFMDICPEKFVAWRGI